MDKYKNWRIEWPPLMASSQLIIKLHKLISTERNSISFDSQQVHSPVNVFFLHAMSHCSDLIHRSR
jgi:hypothetical protein